MTSIFRIQLLSDTTRVPTRSTSGAAGYDLYSPCNSVVPARGRVCIPIKIVIQVPEGTYGRIAPRSGLAYREGLDVGGGVIDSDYRQEVGVILFNHTDQDYTVRSGERIAQLILEKIATDVQVEITTDLFNTNERGGFGSTGR